MHARPLGDLRDGGIGDALDRGIAGAVDGRRGRWPDRPAPARARRGSRGRRGATVGSVALGLADVHRCRVGHRRVLAEDAGEVVAPVLREQQCVVRQLRQLAADAEHDEHGAGSGVGALPRGIGSTARRGRQQLGLGVMQIGRRHHDVGVDLVRRAVGVEIADAPCAIVAHDDVGDPGARDEPCTGLLGEAGDAVDHLAESALRVQHPVVEVEVAHQVIQARRREGRSAEEHRGVAEHLAQAVVAHVAGDEAIEALEQQAAESPEATQHRLREQRRGRREVVVQEVVEREPRGLVGRVEVALERMPGAVFDRLEQGDSGGPLGRRRRPGRGAARSRRGSPDRAGSGRAALPSSCPSGGRSARTPRA